MCGYTSTREYTELARIFPFLELARVSPFLVIDIYQLYSKDIYINVGQVIHFLINKNGSYFRFVDGGSTSKICQVVFIADQCNYGGHVFQ